MSASQPLFDRIFAGTPEPQGVPLTGPQLAESGIQSALEHVRRVRAEYELNVRCWVALLEKGSLITSEDIRNEVGDPPEDCPNCLAGIMKAAKGLIEITNMTETAKRPSLHGKRLSLWLRI